MWNRLKTVFKVVYPLVIAAYKAYKPGNAIKAEVADKIGRAIVKRFEDEHSTS